MKQQMVIDVIVSIKRRQREPGECGRKKMFRLHVVPQHARPFDVVITVKVAAADSLSCILETPKQ